MCGLGLMGTAEFAKVRYAGPAIALSLGVALVAASLTLTPALLRLLGKTSVLARQSAPPLAVWSTHQAASKRLLELGQPHRCRRSSDPDHVRRRLELCCRWPFSAYDVKPNYRPTSELSPTADSVLGLAAIERHFPVGETGPLTVLLTVVHRLDIARRGWPN